MAVEVESTRFVVRAGRLVRETRYTDTITGEPGYHDEDAGRAPTGFGEEDEVDPMQLRGARTAADELWSDPREGTLEGRMRSMVPSTGPAPEWGQKQGGYQETFGIGHEYKKPPPQQWSTPGLASFQGQGATSMADPNQNPLINPQAYQNPGVPQAPMPGQVPGQPPTAPGTPGAGINTQFAGGQVSTADSMRGHALYSPDNPVGALNNVLQDRGINPFNPGNPFVQFIQRAAPGLMTAYMMQQAKTPGLTAESVANTPFAFRDYVNSAIGGGSVFSGLAGAAGQIPGLVDAIRSQSQAGTSATEVNPFLSAIGQMLSRNFGEGTTDVLQSLLGPTMPKSLAQGYRSGLEQSLSQAQRNFPFEKENADIWQTLLGR